MAGVRMSVSRLRGAGVQDSPSGWPVWLPRLLPFLRWRQQVDRASLRADALAGLTGAIVVLPQGVAFATIAGMPPEYGLYAGILPAIIAALWGSSRFLVSGPTTAASIVLFSSLSALAVPGSPEYVSLALTLTFMVGALELVMGLARLGTLVNFISHSVVVGFTAGAALLIAANQIKHFFGLEMPRGLPLHGTLTFLLSHLHDIKPYVAGVGALTLAVGLVAKRWVPRAPYMLIGMGAGGVAAFAMEQGLAGVQGSIPMVGALPASLPPLSYPRLEWDTLARLAPIALAATLFALTEAVSIARSLGSRVHEQVDGNQEFIGQGLSNLVGSFFSAYVATGSFNRSGLNFQAGAKTPLAAVFAGAMLAGVILLVAPLVAYLPNAAMAGVLFMVAWGLIDLHHIRQILRASRQESAVLLVTFFSTLFLDLEFAILAGVLLSLVLYLNRTSHPHVLTRVPNPNGPKRDFVTDPRLPECPQLKVVRLDGSLFFGAVAHVSEVLAQLARHQPGQRHLAISATGINFIDIAGAEFLAQEAAQRRAAGGGLYLIRPKPDVLKTLDRGGYLDLIGRERCFPGKTTALASIIEGLDPDLCRDCSRRIFRECASRPGAPANATH